MIRILSQHFDVAIQLAISPMNGPGFEKFLVRPCMENSCDVRVIELFDSCSKPLYLAHNNEFQASDGE